MTHWRELMDERPTLGAWDFKEDRTARIKKVEEAHLEGVASKKIKASKRPMLTLEDSKGREWPQKLVCNVTICETIAELYGSDVSKWPGQLITLYASTTRVGKRDGVECVRVRPVRPGGKAKLSEAPTGPVDEAMRQKQVDAAAALREPGSDDT